VTNSNFESHSKTAIGNLSCIKISPTWVPFVRLSLLFSTASSNAVLSVISAHGFAAIVAEIHLFFLKYLVQCPWKSSDQLHETLHCYVNRSILLNSQTIVKLAQLAPVQSDLVLSDSSVL
jgi:hypothetical protein